MIVLALGTAFAATLDVGPTATFPTIRAAVAAATDGDLVSVAPGAYAEALDCLGKELTIESTDGSSSTVVTPPAGADAVTVANGEVLTLTGFTLAPVGGRGLVVSGSGLVGTDLRVEDAGATGSGAGASSLTVASSISVMSVFRGARPPTGDTSTFRGGVTSPRLDWCWMGEPPPMVGRFGPTVLRPPT